MKRFLPFVCAGLLAALLPANAQASSCSYTPSQATTFPNGTGGGQLTDTDGANGYVGTAFLNQNHDPYPHGAVWRDGVAVTDLGALGMAFAVNRSGDAVGWKWGGKSAVYLPRGGTPVPLAIPTGVTKSIPTPTGISDDGLIVGYARYDDGTDHALTWHAGTAGTTYRDLGVTGVRVPLTDVSDDGLAVGTVKRGQFLTAVSGTSLTALGGVDPRADSQANDVAGRFVLGKGTVPGQGTGTVLWENGVPRLLGITGNATDVNLNGVVVGNDSTGPFVVRGNEKAALPKLPGHTTAQALAVTDDGRVLGWSRTADLEQQSVPVIWTCH
ncbi:hypothetical protein [Kribbella deserti]|uniref:HAF family extracellular repeat protein n=1 Tax=Kribbella deserti TaxID=1926257 RepID=A0ABV6QIL4_9ACTN